MTEKTVQPNDLGLFISRDHKRFLIRITPARNYTRIAASSSTMPASADVGARDSVAI